MNPFSKTWFLGSALSPLRSEQPSGERWWETPVPVRDGHIFFLAEDFGMMGPVPRPELWELRLPEFSLQSVRVPVLGQEGAFARISPEYRYVVAAAWREMEIIDLASGARRLITLQDPLTFLKGVGIESLDEGDVNFIDDRTLRYTVFDKSRLVPSPKGVPSLGDDYEQSEVKTVNLQELFSSPSP